MANWKIPLSDLDFGPEEEQAVQRVLASKWLTMGEETQCFEREFAEMLGVKHAVAVANGTAALHLALLALDVGANDAVLQPAVNFVASANMTIAVGATPVFVDIHSLSDPTISPESLSTFNFELSTLRPRAVVVMHYGGHPCKMDEIKAICEEHNLALIEDACHGVGGKYGSQAAGPAENSAIRIPHSALGSLGAIGCFSFFSNKNMATGEGGMVTTNRDDVAEKVRLLRSHGMTSLTLDRHKGHASTYDVACHGFNYRIDELRSAIGREQLKKLPKNNQRRRELTSLYWDKLAPLESQGWTLPFKTLYASSLASTNQQIDQSTNHPACHLMPVVAPDAVIRQDAADSLKDAGIQSSLHYPFIPEFEAFAGYEQHGVLENAKGFCERVITLPLYPTMSDTDAETVCEMLLQAAQ